MSKQLKTIDQQQNSAVHTKPQQINQPEEENILNLTPILHRAVQSPHALSPTETQTLQRTIGNQAIGRITIQRKTNDVATVQRQENEEELQMMPLTTVQHSRQETYNLNTSNQLQSEHTANSEHDIFFRKNNSIQRNDQEPEGKPATLKIHADIDADSMGIGELMEGSVGHAWVSLHWNDPTAVPADIHANHKPFLQQGDDPFGFWPKMFQDYDPILDQWQEAEDRVGYSSNPFNSYVPGQMLHPDRMHTPRASQIYQITRQQADNVINYAESKRGAPYSVYYYNCTTFAHEAAKAAGVSPPGSSTLGIHYPNALYDSIKKNHEKKRGTTELTDVEGNTTRVEGSESKKNK